MEVKEMKELIAAVSSANVDEFEYNNEEFSIRIAKKKAKIATVDASVAGVPVQSAAIMPEQNEEQPEELLYGDEIKAPLVGTFYVAPSEGAEPFVSVGDKVKKGQVIGIVEAMKLMNEVESEYDGTVAAILVENGEMVEYGQPLMSSSKKGRIFIMVMDIKDIMNTIPHRSPFLLVDRIEEMEEGKRIVGKKCVTYNEPFFAGHFPQEPVMPGVLIIEALAQTGAVCALSADEYKGKIAFLGGVNKAKFRGKVVPGDVLTLEVEMIKVKGPVGVAQGTATVDGKKVASAEITFMIG